MSSHPSSRRIGMAALLMLGMLTACTAPTRQYVAADGYGMYFALPATWSRVPSAQLATAQRGWSDDAGGVITQTLRWQGAWTAAHANANQVLAASAPRRPVLYAFVRDLIDVERQGIGSDITSALQDLVLPSTAILDNGGEVRTQAITRAGHRGIHQFATYASGGVMQTVEVVSVLATDQRRVFSVMARCTEQCFSDNSGAINAVFDSLTFKETRGQ